MGGREWHEIKFRSMKAIIFTRAPVKNPLGYTLGDQRIRKVSSHNSWV